MPSDAKGRVLIVEDEQSIRDMLRYALRIAGFDVDEADCVASAKKVLADNKPDVILLDWMLPDVSGLEFTKQIKAASNTKRIPIILLTAKASEENKVAGLDAGADDYVVKPFSPRELIARIHAVLRRGAPDASHERIEVRDMIIDLEARQVFYRNDPIKFGPLEYKLLCFFAKHPGRVYSRDDLLSHVWGSNAYIDERTVDVHIRRLRKRLSTCGYDDLIQTVHGMGYRFSQKSGS
jgi:two-component system, OmpR family, phosphate regulon response regulator PhoB